MSTQPETTSSYPTRYQRKRKADAIEIINRVWGPNSYDHSMWSDQLIAKLPKILPSDFDPWGFGWMYHRVQPAYFCGTYYYVDEKLVPLLERINSGEPSPLTTQSCQGDPKENLWVTFNYDSYGKLVRKVIDRHNQMAAVYKNIKTVWTEFFLKPEKWAANLEYLRHTHVGRHKNRVFVRLSMKKEDIAEFVQLWDIMFDSPDKRLVKRLRGTNKSLI